MSWTSYLPMPANDEPMLRRRRTRWLALIPIAMILFVIGCTWVLISVFNAGPQLGLMTSGAVILAYSVPATLFDWPRLTLEAIGAFFEWVWDVLTSWWN